MMEAFKGIPTQKVHVSLTDAEGKTILDEDVEFPAGWDYNDILVVSSRYLCNSAKRKELSLFDMIERVSKRLAEWAAEVYGWNEEQKNAFAEKLAWFQVHRYFAFNSPVYFNVGLDGEELAHACFILDVEDSLESIYDWIQREMRIFRRGAGSGVNLSKLRGSVERVSGGGCACLTGDTVIINESRRHKFSTDKGIMTIEELYRQYQAGQPMPKIRCMAHCGFITENKVKAVVYNGVQKVYRITTKRGYTIKATDNHRFLSLLDGWKEVRDFSVGEQIAINGARVQYGTCIRCGKTKQLYATGMYAGLCSLCSRELNMDWGRCKRCGKERCIFPEPSKYAGYCESCSKAIKVGRGLRPEKKVGVCKRCGRERSLRVIGKYVGYCDSCAVCIQKGCTLMGSPEWKQRKKEAVKKWRKLHEERKKQGYFHPYWAKGPSNPLYKGRECLETTARQRIRVWYPELKEINYCHFCGKLCDEEDRIEIHHIDGDPYNNDLSNLLPVCQRCHHRLHITRRYRDTWEYRLYVDFDEIVSIEYVGEEPVYDIQMEDPYHNFVANGFISHNSGPVSFLAISDVSAATIKSGGRLRRAAKLARLDCWHIDIEKFITAKQHQEKKARILVEEGVITDPIGEVPLQATNLSVGVTDEFMRAVINDKEWELRGVKDDIKKVVRAKELFEKITTAAWDVGCPGLQFHDTINKYNPALRQLPDGGLENEIMGSNPCVLGDTLVTTPYGVYEIKELVGKKVPIWDGDGWVDVDNFRVTGKDQEVLRIHLSDGSHIDATPYHRMVLEDGVEVEARDLRIGDRLFITIPDIKSDVYSDDFSYLKMLLRSKEFSISEIKNSYDQRVGATRIEVTGNPNDLRVLQATLKAYSIPTYLRTEYGRVCLTVFINSSGDSVFAKPVNEVTKIEKLPGKHTVYCCTVKTNHKFTINGNILVGQCSEYLAQPNTACNLASLNLLRFYDKGKFNHKLFNEAVNVLVRAMTAISYKADYPDERIRKGTQKFHNIGIGYTNLAALLLTLGLPYDSDEAAYHVGLLTAYLQGCAIKVSQKIANELGGPYPEFTPERHKEVISIFKEDALALTSNEHYQDRLNIRNLAHSLWKKLDPGKPTHNAQFTLLAPTGTISFLMGAADSTGIEPFYSLVTQKRLMDGKVLTLVPKAMVAKLTEIYGESKATEIAEYIVKNGTFPSDVDPSVKRLFKCAISDDPECAVSLDGRIKVAAAAQKFLSGAISITFNLPNSATPQDVAKVYMKAWESGLKGVTIYRDGSKAIQVLYSKNKRITPKPAKRYPLPQERYGKIKKFRINSVKGYILTGEYPDGSLGEIYLRIAKEGSTLSGLLDALAIVMSIALQHGVPLDVFVDKLKGSKFEPAGFTGEEDIPFASSLVDYIAKYLELSYLKRKEKKETFIQEGTGMFCHKCGSEMVRKGGCYVCKTCGETSGSCE